MATETVFLSRYDRRLSLVQGIMTANSAIDDKAAREIAVQVLHALDRIPEKVR